MREDETVATTSDGLELREEGSLGTTSEVHLGVLATTSRERSPLHVYLSRLSEGSRPTMSEALSRVARIPSAGRLEAHQLPWHELRYQRTGYPNGSHRLSGEANGEAAQSSDDQQDFECNARGAARGLAARADDCRGLGPSCRCRGGEGIEATEGQGVGSRRGGGSV